MRTLSSSARTNWYKYLFPVIWIGGFGAGTLALWLGALRGSNDELPPSDMRWGFLLMWIAGSTFILWFGRRVKYVEADEKNLHISSYSNEVSVPLNDVSDVTENRAFRPPTVTIHFRDSTRAGKNVVFIPPFRIYSPSPHPVIGELTELCKLARG
jgi:hypothetical protein